MTNLGLEKKLKVLRGVLAKAHRDPEKRGKKTLCGDIRCYLCRFISPHPGEDQVLATTKAMEYMTNASIWEQKPVAAAYKKATKELKVLRTLLIRKSKHGSRKRVSAHSRRPLGTYREGGYDADFAERG